MKQERVKLSKSKILHAINLQKRGFTVEELCKKYRISKHTFYKWKKEFGESIKTPSKKPSPPENKKTSDRVTKEIRSLNSIIHRYKNDEDKLVKANRLIALSSSINALIIHSKNESEILSGICRVSVQHGKFIMAWFGLANHENGILEPICSYGQVDGYFSSVPKISFRKIPEGKGPAGRAYREKKLIINNNIADTSDRRYNLWREEALSRGYQSSIGIPIFKKSELYGVFSLYHPQPFFFNKSEQKSLYEIGQNLTFAINNIHAEIERERLENELRSTYNSLLKAHTQMDHFAYRASHDLRGPISTLLGLCAVGQMELKNIPTAKDILDRLESTANSLDNTLRRLLSALDIKNRDVKLLPVSFDIMFSNIGKKFSEDNLHLTTSIDTNITLNSDSELLQIAFENLIENSLTHKKPTSTHCHVHITAQLVDSQKISIKITDDGVGIPMEIRDRIFDMFFKGSPLSKGPGIGLYLVKNIAYKLGGLVRLCSSDKERTEFEIILPLE